MQSTVGESIFNMKLMFCVDFTSFKIWNHQPMWLNEINNKYISFSYLELYRDMTDRILYVLLVNLFYTRDITQYLTDRR